MGYWVVVVDDDALALRYARNLLREQDLRVSCLRSGSDLLKFMETNSPDLVLLDILMPEMDGFECFHALRQMEEEKGRRATPVIFLTGDVDYKNERRGLKDGASDFIRKPFDKDILLSRIINTIENEKKIESLTKKASLDKLTGFLNKTSGAEKIAQLCSEKTGALFIFDLDNFKLVNDIYGHDMGDQVLIAFSEIMRHSTRSDDVVSRIGGDEFLVFFVNLTQEIEVTNLTERLNAKLRNKCIELMGDEFDIPIGISVGVSLVPEHSRDYDTLFRNADAAMYQVKQNGKHGVEIFDPSASNKKISNISLDEDLAHISVVMAERGKAEGAKVLGKDVFVHTYQVAIRFLRRYEKNAEKMLFSLTSVGDADMTVEASAFFMDAMQKSLRETDIMVQIKPGQFFALLPDTTREEAEDIRKKLMDIWEHERFHDNVSISYSSEFVPFSAL